MTLLAAAVVLLVASCHAQYGPLVVPYYQPLVQPYYDHIAPNVLTTYQNNFRSILETKSGQLLLLLELGLSSDIQIHWRLL